MVNITKNLISYYLRKLWPLLGTYLSLLGVIISLRQEQQKQLSFGLCQKLFLWFGTILFLYLCYDKIKSEKRLRYKKKKDWQTPVRKYMYKWIHNGNRVAIYSHDLSWVDEGMKDLLCQKAEKHELLICLPEHTDLTKQLEETGGRDTYIWEWQSYTRFSFYNNKLWNRYTKCSNS